MDDAFELDTAPPPRPVSASYETGPVEKESETDNRLDRAEKIFDTSSQISSSQEATRAKIAWVFTQIFLLLVIIALVLPTIISIGFPGTFDTPVETTKELVTLIASVLAGPFGFIVGFYFKEREQ